MSRFSDQITLAGSNVPINGQVDAVSGTSVTLSAASNKVGSVTVVAKKANSSPVYLGAAGVNDTNGIILNPGEAFTFSFVDLSVLFVYGTSGDGVFYGGVK